MRVMDIHATNVTLWLKTNRCDALLMFLLPHPLSLKRDIFRVVVFEGLLRIHFFQFFK